MSLFKSIGNIASPVNGLIHSLFGRAFNPGSTTQDQVPLQTPEQRQAMEMLSQFMKTGVFGNFTAGADTGVDTNLSKLESSGQSMLEQLLNGGLPAQFQMGDKALADLLNPDPAFIQSQFDPFKTQVQREIANSNNALKRNSGFAGNLYSTNTIKRLGDIEARGNETLTSQLASLTNQALDRRLSAIPLAYQSGQAQEGILQDRIATSQLYGGRARDLSNQEILRRRNELMLPINAANSLIGANANFGVPSVTTQNPNPFMDLLQALIRGGSTILAGR